MHPLSVLAFVVWCLLVAGEVAFGIPIPNPQLREFPPVPNGLDLQRVGALSSSTSATSGDYSDAIYAARFAIELDRLEKQRNEIFSDFIFSGFMNEEVPRELPVDLQKLSRTSSPPLITSPSSLRGSVTSSSSFRFPGEVRRRPLTRGSLAGVPVSEARGRSFASPPRARSPFFGRPFVRRASV